MKNPLKSTILAALMFSASLMMHAADGNSATAAPHHWSKPVLVAGKSPVYPREARSRGVEGTVVIEAMVAPDGKLVGAEVVRKVHPALDAEALKAVHSWTFAPARPGSTITGSVLRLPVTFSTEGAEEKGLMVAQSGR